MGVNYLKLRLFFLDKEQKMGIEEETWSYIYL